MAGFVAGTVPVHECASFGALVAAGLLTRFAVFGRVGCLRFPGFLSPAPRRPGFAPDAHSFRFGGEYTRYDINHFQPQAAFGPRGGFNFTGGLTTTTGLSPSTYNGYADCLLGMANSMGKDVQYINPSAVRMPGWG